MQRVADTSWQVYPAQEVRWGLGWIQSFKRPVKCPTKRLNWFRDRDTVLAMDWWVELCIRRVLSPAGRDPFKWSYSRQFIFSKLQEAARCDAMRPAGHHDCGPLLPVTAERVLCSTGRRLWKCRRSSFLYLHCSDSKATSRWLSPQDYPLRYELLRHSLTASSPGQPGSAGTRNVKPAWI